MRLHRAKLPVRAAVGRPIRSLTGVPAPLRAASSTATAVWRGHRSCWSERIATLSPHNVRIRVVWMEDPRRNPMAGGFSCRTNSPTRAHRPSFPRQVSWPPTPARRSLPRSSAMRLPMPQPAGGVGRQGAQDQVIALKHEPTLGGDRRSPATLSSAFVAPLLRRCRPSIVSRQSPRLRLC